MIKSIILASPRGPCAGVNRALDIIHHALKKYKTPLYVNHDLVHNKHVVHDLKQRGVIFEKNIERIPKGAVYLFSAHGVSPDFRRQAKKRNLHIIDATCPLVTKVHTEAKKYADENAIIFFIGHKGHPEAEGTTGVTKMFLIENINDAKAIHPSDYPTDKPIVVLTQTTLSTDDTAKILKILRLKFPNIKTPPGKDICYATTNRQEAVKKLSNKCDFILVVGSKHSSNSNRLVETARSSGTESILIDNFSEVPHKNLKNIQTLGITSGASVPDVLVEKLVNDIKRLYNIADIQTLEVLKENVQFSLPKI